MSVCTKYLEMLLNIRKETLNGSVLESPTIHIRWILLYIRKNIAILQYDSQTGFMTSKFPPPPCGAAARRGPWPPHS